MAANFTWDKAKDRIVEAARNALLDVGYVLNSRRLHLGLSQGEIAKRASKALGTGGAIKQPDISALENGELPQAFSGAGYAAIDAVLVAYEWRSRDRVFMRHMIKEFARVE